MTYELPTLDTENTLRLPVGATSPLWLLIGGAAVAGAAFFWTTRWLKLSAANLEAAVPVLPKPEPEVARAAEKAAAIVEAAPAAIVEEVTETLAEIADLPADDLTVMTGIGPKMAQMLADKGVTRFAQIAAWTDAEIEVLDKELRLMGRVAREAWVAQAKRLAGVDA